MFKLIPLLASLMLLSFSSNAALIDNGTYTTDTASGLDWLDLSETAGLSYNEAGNLAGWRHATNAEVGDLFAQAFDGYYETASFGRQYSRSGEGEYADQLEDILAFRTLFGYTSTPEYGYGFYEDENAVLTVMGYYISTSENRVFGMNFIPSDYSGMYDTGSPFFATYLVRGAAVPAPGALLLFAPALFGLYCTQKSKR